MIRLIGFEFDPEGLYFEYRYTKSRISPLTSIGRKDWEEIKQAFRDWTVFAFRNFHKLMNVQRPPCERVIDAHPSEVIGTPEFDLKIVENLYLHYVGGARVE